MIHADVVEVEGKKWIKVYFKPVPRLIEKMKKVKGAMYNPKSRLWAVPYENLRYFEAYMENHLILWEGKETMAGGIPEESIPPSPIVDYEFKTKPFDYQIRGFNAIVERNFLILADDMGLGKTFQLVTAIAAKKQIGKLKRGVVMCKASLLYNWRDEIHKHSNEKAVIYAGTKKQRSKMISDLQKDDSWTFLIISYGTFRNDVSLLDDLDTSIPLDFVALDESHVIKNPTSKIGSVIHNIPFRYKYLLTGTPLPNTPLEAYNYLRLGGKVHINWWQFQRRYAIMGGYDNKEVLGYDNIKELRELVQENMLRRSKEEKLHDLPPAIISDIKLQMSKGQAKLYEAVKKEILEDLKDTTLDSVPSALSKLVRLQQITDAPEILGSKERSIKLEALDEFLDDLISGGQKAIIFSRFKTMVNIMSERYAEYNPAVIHGDIASIGKSREQAERSCAHLQGAEKEEKINELMTSERQKEVYKFQKDKNCKIFIGCAPACREGLTLTASSTVIFLDSEWSYAYYSQAYSRAHRIGQKSTVNVYNFVCEGTIDEKVLDIIKRKEAMSQALLDNKVGKFGATKAREFIQSMM